MFKLWATGHSPNRSSEVVETEVTRLDEMVDHLHLELLSMTRNIHQERAADPTLNAAATAAATLIAGVDIPTGTSDSARGYWPARGTTRDTTDTSIDGTDQLEGYGRTTGVEEYKDSSNDNACVCMCVYICVG